MTDFTVVVDSREKKPYSFYGVDVIRNGLQTGDYTIKGYEDTFAVERKSLDDLANTLGAGRKRFKNELSRAETFDEFAVVIEASEEMLYDRDDDGHCPHYYSKIWPNAILGTVRKWPRRYSTLEFHWAGDRAGGKAKTLDLLTDWYSDY